MDFSGLIPKDLPRGLTASSEEGEIKLYISSHRISGFLILTAGVFWLIMLPITARTLSGGSSFGLPEAIAFTPFLAMATIFCYVGLVKLVNKTEITFTATEVSVCHRPLPWPGQTEVPTQTIKGYQVKRDLRPKDLRYRVTLGLVANLKIGKPKVLINAISNIKIARTLHEVATSHLDLLSKFR